MPYIQIYDTTLRDGSQGEGVNFSLQDKLSITKKLDEVGIDFIEGGYPLSNPKDAEYFQRVRDLPLKHAKICAFGMTRRKGCVPEDDVGMCALRDARTDIVTIVGKSWNLHVLEVLHIDEAENLAMIRDSVSFLKAEGKKVFYDAEHFFDGFRENRDFALKTVVEAQEAGARMIVLCDTNGGRLPEEIAAAVEAVRDVLKVEVEIGIHCHNDCELAVANSLIAIGHGATQVQGTINGIGERCGNADLISVIGNLALKKKGHKVLGGPDVQQHDFLLKLTELSRYVYEIANMNFRNSQAFVGTSAFAHKGGMHVHAVNRVSASYEHIDPKEVGNERRVLVSELSGRSNIIAKTTQHQINHDNGLMTRILERVQDLENEGYQFEAAEASFDLLVRKVAGTYQPKFKLEKYHVRVMTNTRLESIDEATDTNLKTTTEATIKLQVQKNSKWTPIHVVADGNGPVNALDKALRKALEDTYPKLNDMELDDYKVRVINSAEATAARVRVVIESKDKVTGEVWGTVGVSENVIEASWLALVDSVEYKLYKDAETT